VSSRELMYEARARSTSDMGQIVWAGMSSNCFRFLTPPKPSWELALGDVVRELKLSVHACSRFDVSQCSKVRTLGDCSGSVLAVYQSIGCMRLANARPEQLARITLSHVHPLVHMLDRSLPSLPHVFPRYRSIQYRVS
jgi:hypothetical protein